MRCLIWMGLGLVGVALVAPTATLADPPASGRSTGATARPRRSMFQKPHLCAQCQWAALRAKGVNVPPPPPMPMNQGGLVASQDRCDRCGASVTAVGPSGLAVAPSPPPAPMIAYEPPMQQQSPAPMMAGGGAPCVACAAAGSGAVVLGPNGMPMSVNDGGMAGHATAGGGVPGYVVVGGTIPIAEPTPIGVIQGQYAYQNAGGPTGRPGMGMPMPGGPAGSPAGMGRGGLRSGDPSVMPSSFSADTLTNGASGRPHILSHLFGVDALGSRSREDRERRKRENHAAISYEQQAQQVNELPTSMVYGR